MAWKRKKIPQGLESWGLIDFGFFYHTQLMILQGDIILLWVWSIELICLLLLQL
jgi:hypothetical protein